MRLFIVAAFSIASAISAFAQSTSANATQADNPLVYVLMVILPWAWLWRGEEIGGWLFVFFLGITTLPIALLGFIVLGGFIPSAAPRSEQTRFALFTVVPWLLSVALLIVGQILRRTRDWKHVPRVRTLLIALLGINAAGVLSEIFRGRLEEALPMTVLL